ncbi:hypothetical protein JL721_7601 [Aureococcus anophagefferens]|nr:hypothetical protein JL721_7601 [Aureococcus anophagefferens]
MPTVEPSASPTAALTTSPLRADGAPSAATTTTASTTTAASTSTPDSGALEEQDGADFVVVDAGEYAYSFDASYSYAGMDSPGEMIFDAEFDFGEFTAPDEGAFDAEDTVLISEPVASDCAAICAGHRRRLRFGSFRGVGDCEC